MENVIVKDPFYFIRDKQTRDKLLIGPGYILKLGQYFPIGEDKYKAKGELITYVTVTKKGLKLTDFIKFLSLGYMKMFSTLRPESEEIFNLVFLKKRSWVHLLKAKILAWKGLKLEAIKEANDLMVRRGNYLTGHRINVEFVIPDIYFEQMVEFDAYAEFKNLARQWGFDNNDDGCGEEVIEGSIAISFESQAKS